MPEGYKRPKTYKIDVSEPDKKTLETLAMRHKLSQKEIVGYLIGIADKYKLLKPGWEDRLSEDDKKRERYAGLDGACANMTFRKEDYICVRAVLGKPPNIKALSNVIEEALDICAICEEDTRKKLDRDETLERVKTLEAQLEAKTSEKFKVPVCTYGGTLSADGVSFEGCRLNPGKLCDIEKYCKLRMNGKPCSSYVERVIGVGKKV